MFLRDEVKDEDQVGGGGEEEAFSFLFLMAYHVY